MLLNLCSLLSVFTIPAAFAPPAGTESTFDVVSDARGSLDSSTDSAKLLPNVLETVPAGQKCNKRREQRAEIQQHFFVNSLLSALCAVYHTVDSDLTVIKKKIEKKFIKNCQGQVRYAAKIAQKAVDLTGSLSTSFC